jgi:CheY-like chemotaxis protein
VDGKIDVWSEEGVGTEVKVTFMAESLDDSQGPLEPKFLQFGVSEPLSISLVGFDRDHKGVQLLYTAICSYLISWWGFEIQPIGSELGDVIILNEDPSLVKTANDTRDSTRPFIILSSTRRNPHIAEIANAHERLGGFCRVVHKPGGPSRLGSLLKLCLHLRKMSSKPNSIPLDTGQLESQNHEELGDLRTSESHAGSHSSRRYSEGSTCCPCVHPTRPGMGSRSFTDHSAGWSSRSSSNVSQASAQTISVGPGGTLLESSVGTIDKRQFRVLVVEDNSILRNLLCVSATTFWLIKFDNYRHSPVLSGYKRKHVLVDYLRSSRTDNNFRQGYSFSEAVDGRHGVTTFENEGPFEYATIFILSIPTTLPQICSVVLLDLSMPILDGKLTHD